MTTTLVPCLLCGANKGYTLRPGSTHRWWLQMCCLCDEQVSECSADHSRPHTAPLPYRWKLANDAWNSAGAHAQGLRDENARLRSVLNAMLTQFGMDEDEWSKPTFNQARAALAKEPK